jgi:ABC-type proline/glycine betaine transport system permease subunit
VFTGNPTGSHAAPGDNDTSIATTAFVAAGFLPIANPTFTGVQTGPHYVANGANANGLGYSHTRVRARSATTSTTVAE